jgi:hypothetical protein
VYGGFIDKVPFGTAFAKGLAIKMGQTHVHKYMRPLLERIEKKEIDPTFVITHRVPLANAADAYRAFAAKRDHCIKVVLKPQEQPVPEEAAKAPVRILRPQPAQAWATAGSEELQQA